MVDEMPVIPVFVVCVLLVNLFSLKEKKEYSFSVLLDKIAIKTAD